MSYRDIKIYIEYRIALDIEAIIDMSNNIKNVMIQQSTCYLLNIVNDEHH